MALMQYKAMDERGKVSLGRMEAVNEADLELRLRRMGLDLINYSIARTKSGGVGRRKVRRRELITFCLQLEQLVRSGVPVIEGLSDLRDTVEDRGLRETIASMVESIEGGKTLSDAMAEHPHVFDDVFVNLMKAGEYSGQVSEVLHSITDNLKWQDEQASQIKRVMTYPAFVGVAILLVLVFLMVYLVPQLVSFIRTMGQELPLHTQILIAVSSFFQKFWYLLFFVPVALVIAVMTLINTSPAAAYAFDRFKLNVWVLGPIIKKMILARFANYFALMYRSGITVLECVRVCEGLVQNKVIEDATKRAGRQIADGASISAGFESTGMFPPLVLRMLKVGESTGALDTALMNISYFYNRDVEESVERLQTMLGPAMTVLMGSLLAWVIASVFGPIYDIITKIDL